MGKTLQEHVNKTPKKEDFHWCGSFNGLAALSDSGSALIVVFSDQNTFSGAEVFFSFFQLLAKVKKTFS